MLCGEVCKDLLPPEEYFEYGLWLPADKYRPETDSEPEPEGEGEQGPEKTRDEDADRKAVEEKKSEMTQKFEAMSGGSREISCDKAANLARALGFAPSLSEIAELKQEHGDNITQAVLENWLTQVAHVDDSVDELIKFFAYYDTKHTGTLSKTQVTNLLRSYGEPLTDAEISGIFTELGVSGDNVDYRQLVSKLLAK